MGKLLDNHKLKKQYKMTQIIAPVCPIVKSKFQFYSVNQSPNINSICQFCRYQRGAIATGHPNSDSHHLSFYEIQFFFCRLRAVIQNFLLLFFSKLLKE